MLTPESDERSREVASGNVDTQKPLFSVIIPAFNEERRIAKTLSKWVGFLNMYFGKGYELLVVMDGCTDNTPNIVLDLAKKNNAIIPIIYPRRLGKGGALREAFKRAKGDFIFFVDADDSLPVHEFLKFVEAIRTSDLAVCCRYWEGSSFISSLPFRRLLLSRIFNIVLGIFFKELRRFRDTQCGAKAIRRSALLAIKDDLFISDFAFDVNLIYSAIRKGFTVTNVYVNWVHHDYDSKVSSNLLKISFMMLISILKLRIYYSPFKRLLRLPPRGIIRL